MKLKLHKDLHVKQFSMQDMMDFVEHCQRNHITIDLDYALIRYFEDKIERLNNL